LKKAEKLAQARTKSRAKKRKLNGAKVSVKANGHASI
jgi:hypothetical protein